MRSNERSPVQRDSSPISIREATDQDAAVIAELALEADMGALSFPGRSFVATDDQRVLGFIRIVELEDCPHISPIVVCAEARGRGIGRALMDYAGKRYGELRFVARGSAVPFYEALGCTHVDWDDIAPLIASDCPDCEDRLSCCPQPMTFCPETI